MRKEELEKKLDELIKQNIKKIELHSDDVKGYYELGVLLTDCKEFQLAEELFIKALSRFKSVEECDLLFYGLGNVLYSANEYTNAMKYFRKIKGPKLLSESYLMIAQCFYAQEQYQQSLGFALTVSEKMQQNTSSKLLIAKNFIALGDFKNAKKYLDEFLVLDDKDFDAWFQRGVVALVLDENEDNVYFGKAKQIDKNKFFKMKERLIEIQEALIIQAKKKGGSKK
ncbi:tetratricopeptide repeat protein [Liquorilactobacillus cacaonum]|uniref:Uncharacterized protein n=1 Tax=Liquorilactobacillus cacaonum DSM 21116 TaxID=1423729 RepID=A0A0R2CGY5_9LACO|nr:tetratricopeptide repeat protein [Liquorilactobacillus cacaonum]KRM90743.1 hypothetical protein FC80_GL000734 [Liquorilactobacillus cacaonum DSM 21116]